MKKDLELRIAANRLAGYCSSAGFLLSLNMDKEIKVHRQWFERLLEQVKEVDVALVRSQDEE